jgi:hypothetical protein
MQHWGWGTGAPLHIYTSWNPMEPSNKFEEEDEKERLEEE